MEKRIKIIRNYWSDYQEEAREKRLMQQICFDEMINPIFGVDQFYYIIDFSDNFIYHISQSIKEIHGLCPKTTTYSDILKRVHPEDLNFVSKVEDASLDFILKNIEEDNFLNYKNSYNFRAKTKDGKYALFNHQTVILTLNENRNPLITLNIRTKIDYLNIINCKTYSLIGLNGRPSYLNLKTDNNTCFSKREMEVIELIADGTDNEGIAEKLSISPLTVKKHRSNILSKSDCKSIAQLIKKSILSGII